MRIRLAAALAAMVLIPAAAQAQTTLTACYVPGSGSVYRIKAPGTPTVCKSSHVEFSWEAASETLIPEFLPTAYSESFPVNAGETKDLTFSCPATAGALVTGGYLKAGPDPENLEIRASVPDGAVEGWFVRATNHGTEGMQVVINIRCHKN